MKAREVLEELFDIASQSYPYWNYVEPECQKHIDTALLALKEMVLNKKKGRIIYFGEDCTADRVKGFNQAIKLIASLFEEGK